MHDKMAETTTKQLARREQHSLQETATETEKRKRQSARPFQTQKQTNPKLWMKSAISIRETKGPKSFRVAELWLELPYCSRQLPSRSRRRSTSGDMRRTGFRLAPHGATNSKFRLCA